MVTKGKIRKGQFGLQTPEQIFQSNFAFNGSNIGSVTGALDPNKLGGLTYNFANDPSIIQQLDQNSSNFDLLATANSMIQMKDPKGGTSLVKTNLNKFLDSALTGNTISPSSIVNSKLTKDLTRSLTSVIGNSSSYQTAIKAADKAKGITGLFGKAGGLSKANNALSKSMGGMPSTGGLVTSALSVADRFIPQAEDKASKITSGVFNGLSTVASFVPGIGTLASVALKGLGSLFGAGVKSVKGNTANELVDTSSSYTGEDALASKKFGLLGLRGAKKYAGLVTRRQYNRDLAANVLQEGKDDLLAANNVQQQQMRDTLSKNGDDWMYTNTLSAKNGAKIKEVKRLSSLYSKRLISKEPLKEGTTVEFKNGGSINVIPEGALHARKNNLTEINPELEGITKKGIPVISKEEGGEMIQHAEIERSEIIFNLETTKKLESLREQYNKSEDKTKKDNLAIEAGKLLAQQIMENTIDNTGELLK